MPPISTHVSEDDVQQGFQKWKERTTTSPSGRHLGHYRSLVQDPILRNCFTQFMNIIIATGITPYRWGNAVNVLIEKDAGQPKINLLRIIHLFEANYNLFPQIDVGLTVGSHSGGPKSFTQWSTWFRPRKDNDGSHHAPTTNNQPLSHPQQDLRPFRQ